MEDFNLRKYLDENQLLKEGEDTRFKEPQKDKHTHKWEKIDQDTEECKVCGLRRTIYGENEIEDIIADEEEIASRVKKLGKEEGFTDRDIGNYVSDLSGHFEPEAYENITDVELLKDLKLYIELAEGKLLKELHPDQKKFWDEMNTDDEEAIGSSELLDFISNNSEEAAAQVGTDSIIDISIDDLGDIGATDKEGFTGYAFRFPEDVDGEFKGEDGDPPRPIEIAGRKLMYIGYNI